MLFIHSAIESSVFVAVIALLAAFYILNRCADLFVDGSVGLAFRLRIPKIVIGIVLVSLATTAPELTVSLVSALKGSPEIALVTVRRSRRQVRQGLGGIGVWWVSISHHGPSSDYPTKLLASGGGTPYNTVVVAM